MIKIIKIVAKTLGILSVIGNFLGCLLVQSNYINKTIGFIGNLNLKSILKIFGIVILFYYPQNSIFLLNMYNIRNNIKNNLDFYISNLILLFIKHINKIINKLKNRKLIKIIINLDLISLLISVIITVVLMNIVENILNDIIALKKSFVENINNIYLNYFDNSLSLIQIDIEILNKNIFKELFGIKIISNINYPIIINNLKKSFCLKNYI